MLIILTFESNADRQKFEYLFNQYKRLLLYKAYGILRDCALAEDAVSEAYIRIYRNLNKITDVQSPQAVSFLITIVKNTSLTLLDKRKNTDAYDSFDHESDGFDLEKSILSEVITNDMLKLVDRLNEDIRAPFLLKYAHDLSHREIAALLHITENNVTVRIHRAKKKLAVLFKEAGYGHGK